MGVGGLLPNTKNESSYLSIPYKKKTVNMLT